jgi:hypothetical protein
VVSHAVAVPATDGPTERDAAAAEPFADDRSHASADASADAPAHPAPDADADPEADPDAAARPDGLAVEHGSQPRRANEWRGRPDV